MQKENNGSVFENGSLESSENTKHNKPFKILTMAEVASVLRVSYSTVVRLALSGKLKSYKVGRRRMFKDGDVLKFLEEGVDRGHVFGEEL